MSRPIDLVLGLVDDAIQHSGDTWYANCPTEHSSKGRKLVVKEGDDGRVLLHCYAGCSAGTICDGLGISLNDLFPQQKDESQRAEGRRIGARRKALETLRMEALVLHLGAADLLDSRKLSETDVERLRVASRKVYKAMMELFT